MESDKRNILIDVLPLAQAANQRKIQGWYDLYFIPTMTQLDALDKLPAKRGELLNDLKNTRTDATHGAILDIIYTGVKKITAKTVTSQGGNEVLLHPAVRYNAMLLLGDLNGKELKGSQRLPYPYTPAFNFLVRTAFLDKTQPDYLRMAALVGIMRHAKLDLPRKPSQITAKQRTKLIEFLMMTVNQKTPPETIKRTAAGHVWMRRRSIEIIGILGGLQLPAGGKQTSAILQQIVADTNEASSLRCTAAATLRLTSDKAQFDSLAATKTLGLFATQICRRELAWIDTELAKKPKVANGNEGFGGGLGGMGEGDEEEGYGEGGLGGLGGARGMSAPSMGMGGMGSGMMGQGMGGFGGELAKDPRLDIARRRLKYQLVCVDDGLTGVVKVKTSDADSVERKKILDRFAAILKATDLVDLEEGQTKSLDTLAKRVRHAMSELEAITGGPPVDPEAEVEEPAISAEPTIESGPAAIPSAEPTVEDGPSSEPAPTPSPEPTPAPAPAGATGPAATVPG
jgi:hypothetical protein